jgi:hypothetical protein
MKLNTTCTALNWIADKAQATGSDSFENESWDTFVFSGTLNRAMVRQIRSWVDANTKRTGFHMDHFIITVDSKKIEFDCRMPSDSKANYNKSHILISVYK